MVKIILLGIIISLSSCSSTSLEDTYEHSVKDLLNRDFYELNEGLKDGTQLVRIMFKNPDFKIEEDNYAYTVSTGKYQYLHTTNIFGKITKTINTDNCQVIEFYINNFVAPGYKYYSIKTGSYNGVDCLKLVEMKQQQHWSSSSHSYCMEWVEWFHGESVYLYEY